MKLLTLYVLAVLLCTSCIPKDDCEIYNNNIELSFIEILDADGNNLIASGKYGYPTLTLKNGERLFGRVFPDDVAFRYLLTIIEDGVDEYDSSYELDLGNGQVLNLNLVFSTYVTECKTTLYAIEDATWGDKSLPINVLNGYQMIELKLPADSVATDTTTTLAF